MKYKSKGIFFFLIYIFYMTYLSNSIISKASIIDNKSGNKELLSDNKQILERDLYIIGPGDVLDIRFIGVEELSGKYLILRDGNVQLPLLGTKTISGLTLDKARQNLLAFIKMIL